MWWPRPWSLYHWFPWESGTGTLHKHKQRRGSWALAAWPSKIHDQTVNSIKPSLQKLLCFVTHIFLCCHCCAETLRPSECWGSHLHHPPRLQTEKESFKIGKTNTGTHKPDPVGPNWVIPGSALWPIHNLSYSPAHCRTVRQSAVPDRTTMVWFHLWNGQRVRENEGETEVSRTKAGLHSAWSSTGAQSRLKWDNVQPAKMGWGWGGCWNYSSVSHNAHTNWLCSIFPCKKTKYKSLDLAPDIFFYHHIYTCSLILIF